MKWGAPEQEQTLLWPPEAYANPVFHDVEPFSGRPRMVVTRPEWVRRVVVDNEANYRRPDLSFRLMGPLLGRSIFFSEGQEWQSHRKLIGPSLTPDMMPRYAQMIARGTQKAIADIKPGTPVNIRSVAHHLALAVIMKVLFSTDIGTFGNSVRELILKYHEFDMPTPEDYALPLEVPSPEDDKRAKFRQTWLALLDKIIEQIGGRDLLDTPDLYDRILAEPHYETNRRLTYEEVREHVSAMLVLGHETTALAIFWAMHCLTRYQESQELIADEVRELDFSPDGAAAACENMPITTAVISEVLRLYSPSYTFARQAKAADKLGELEVPEDCVVVLSPHVSGRHKVLWDHATTFDPGRFLDKRPSPYVFMPFGAGVRTCIGQHLAMTEMRLIIGSLLQNFRVTRADDRQVRLMPAILLYPSVPVLFNFERRQ